MERISIKTIIIKKWQQFLSENIVQQEPLLLPKILQISLLDRYIKYGI